METVSKFRIFQNRFFFFPVSRRDKNVSDLPSQNFQFFNDFFSFFSERQWKERKSVTRIPFFSIKGVSKFRIFLFLVSGRDDRILWLKNVNVIEERIYPLRNFQFFNDFSRRKSFFSMERVSKFRIFSNFNFSRRDDSMEISKWLRILNFYNYNIDILYKKSNQWHAFKNSEISRFKSSLPNFSNGFSTILRVDIID